jgi:hypothetical protein
LSLVICTHNPDAAIFTRTLEAIARLRWPGDCAPNVVLVDNASHPALSDDPLVSAWLAQTPGARIVQEDRLGLSYARVRAFREAGGQMIACFDDDNLPAPDYLESVVAAAHRHPDVGVWGPGNVTVEWLEGSDPRVVKRHADSFQERAQCEVTYALDFPHPATMPYGTGMVLRREVAEEYCRWYESGRVRTIGRRGNSLAGCEDLQISWLAMRAGWAVGRHPALHVRHMIPGRRAQLPYVARLTFELTASYSPALREALPGDFDAKAPKSAAVLLQLLVHGTRALAREGTAALPIAIAPVLGRAWGAWAAHDRTPPRWAAALVRALYGVRAERG